MYKYPYCHSSLQANYFARSDVALSGFANFFRRASDEERKHANFLMDYVNKRGGYHELRDIEARLEENICENSDGFSLHR